MKIKEEQLSQEYIKIRHHSHKKPMDDSEVWEDFRRGNQSAFTLLYNKYFDTLYKFGFQFSQDQEFIKDCIQDLFVELINKSNISEVNSVRAYLLVSLRRKIIYYQKRARKFIFKNDLLEGYDFQMSFSHETKIIGQQFEADKKSKLNQAINSILTTRQREAIYHLYYEHLSIDEMAEVMSLSRRAAQNLIYKSIKILKQNFSVMVGLFIHAAVWMIC